MQASSSDSLLTATSDAIIVLPLNGRRLKTINGEVTFVLSMTLNSFLLVIVSRERSTALRAYSNVMKLNCVLDMLYTVVCVLVDFQFEIELSKLIVISGGLFAHASRGWNLIGDWFMSTTFWLSTFTVPTVFYFRYSLVVRNTILKTKQLICVVGLEFVVAAAISVLFTTGLSLDQSSTTCAEALSHPLWTYGGYTVDNCIIGSAHNTIVFVFMMVMVITNVVMYSLMAYFAIAIYRTLKLSKNISNKRTLRLQTQMNQLLIIQTVLPIICAGVPTVVTAVLSSLQYRVIGIGIPLAMVVEWIPLMNPLVAITLITNFRHRAVRMAGYTLNRFLRLPTGKKPVVNVISFSHSRFSQSAITTNFF